MPSKINGPAWLRLWGVRGSIPVPGPSTVRYGGNTSCVEFRAGNELIVLDAGSGIRELGNELEREFSADPIHTTLLSTHAHWDHIQGLPFFGPAYQEKNSMRLFGYKGVGGGFGAILNRQMAVPFFPVRLRDLPSEFSIHEMTDMEFDVGEVHVRAHSVNHPGNCVGYRLDVASGSAVFIPDHEPYEFGKLHAEECAHATPQEARKFAARERDKLVEFIHGADILFLDGQYADEEYQRHMGWGHGSITTALDLAADAKVGKLILFHHDPNHDDETIDQMLARARQLMRQRRSKVEVEAAREGTRFTLGGRQVASDAA